jgi:hypothetical protein
MFINKLRAVVLLLILASLGIRGLHKGEIR